MTKITYKQKRELSDDVPDYSICRDPAYDDFSMRTAKAAPMDKYNKLLDAVKRMADSGDMCCQTCMESYAVGILKEIGEI